MAVHDESGRVQSSEPGLRHEDLGLLLHYHRPGTPWTKPIERVIGMVQDRMNCEPGYVGRNERLDRREDTQKRIAAVESGKLTPEDAGILWFDQFTRLLDAVIQEYNQEVQNGEMLMDTCGLYLSPEQAFIDGICGHPGSRSRAARLLTPEGRARLSTHERKMYVPDCGLNIEIDGHRYPFFDETLEPYRHKDVIAYLNIECPEVLICSDLKRTNFFQVKLWRGEAMTASTDYQKAMNQAKSRFMARSKVAHSKIQPPIISLVARDGSITEPTQLLGEAVNAAVDQHREDLARAEKEEREVSQKLAILGRSPSADIKNPARVKEGVDLEIEALEEIAAMKKETTP